MVRREKMNIQASYTSILSDHNELYASVMHVVSRLGRALLLFPQPHTRRVTIGKLDAGFLEHALDRREIIARRHATSLLEIDNHAARNHGIISQRPLIHLDEAARGAALGGRNRHLLSVYP